MPTANVVLNWATGKSGAHELDVLEPTIGNYFRNAAQGSDIIDFLKNRSLRQEEARHAISGALRQYNVGAADTSIGLMPSGRCYCSVQR